MSACEFLVDNNVDAEAGSWRLQCTQIDYKVGILFALLNPLARYFALELAQLHNAHRSSTLPSVMTGRCILPGT